MRRLPYDIRIAIFLLVGSAVLTLISPEKVARSLTQNMDMALKILLLSIGAALVSVAIHYLIPTAFVERHLQGNKLRYLVYATLLGTLTPGPVYALYPVMLALRKKGVQNPVLVSFITGQTIIGPARAPLEIGLFGVTFFAYRFVLAVVIGPLAGLLYILLSKWLPDRA